MQGLSSKFIVISVLLAATAARAQDADINISPDEIQGGDQPADKAGGDKSGGGQSGKAGGDNGSMNFDVIDTGATAAEVERERKAELDLIRVVQRRPFLRRHRVEVSPMLGSNVNDPLIQSFVAGGTLNYHITEVMAVGIFGAYSLGSESNLFDKVINDYELFPEVAQVLWYGGVQFQYVPVYGKFALFNSFIVPWDIYAVLGAGYTKTELAGHPTLAAGVGNRFFMNRWFNLAFELRDNLYNEDYPSGSQLVNNLVFSAGVGFFLPPDFEYTTLK
jgi:outer membrane beta-barrel protein